MAHFISKGDLTSHVVLLNVLDSLSDPLVRGTALRLTQEILEQDKGQEPADLTIRGARQKILGQPVEMPTFEPVKKPADFHTFEIIAKAWLTWAAGGDPLPLIQSIPRPKEFGGAIHLMALEHWAGAVKALAQNDLEEARRLFLRSTELGEQYITETSRVVLWTYAATFFK